VRFRRLTMLLGVLLLAALALSSGGCNAVGAAVYKINGPPDNRMVGYPYTKTMVAVMDVDMAAAVIVASWGAADRLGAGGRHRNPALQAGSR